MGRKKLVTAAVLITAAALFLVGCSGTKKSEASDDTIVIKEKMFVTQINDIYLNAEDYIGKTIKLQGIFKEEQPYEGVPPYCFVLRYGPGCCGYDGNVGFEIKWDETKAQPYPKDDSWIETTGVLKQYEEDGYVQYLYLDLISLNVLNKRGAEIVYQ